MKCVNPHGYHVGERIKENKLREARNIGKETKHNNGSTFIGFNHPKSVGPCRIAWVKVFQSGYHGYPFDMAGR